MSSSSSLFPLLFVAIFLVLCSQIALSLSPNFFLQSHNDNISPKKFQLTMGEKLIRQLNLFPKHDINIVSSKDNNYENKLFEKKLDLSYLGDSGATVQDLGHHAGYFPLINTKSARMFYFFFESRSNKNDPVVIWLTGGPGCSSELALFYENGPFKISNNMSLVWNDFGWDKVSNLVYVDQPTGTGFSYTSDESDIRHNETGVSNDLYDFLQAFFNAHPEYVNNDFYITGESYAGHYIPAFASRVHQGNIKKEGIHINLKGFAIGNGLTNPEIQYKAYTDYSLDMKLINQTDYDYINQLYPTCQQEIKLCASGSEDACMKGFNDCNLIFDSIMNIAGDINYYDIRKTCNGSLCYDFSRMETYLNDDQVKEALGVPTSIDFVSCSSSVYHAMMTDWMKNLEVGIPQLLEDGINLLIYAGEYDLICNWLGNSNWVHEVEWSGQKGFEAAPSVSFTVDGEEKGVQKKYGPLIFLKVHDAGHMVPMDQPKAALEMLQRWIHAAGHHQNQHHHQPQHPQFHHQQQHGHGHGHHPMMMARPQHHQLQQLQQQHHQHQQQQQQANTFGLPNNVPTHNNNNSAMMQQLQQHQQQNSGFPFNSVVNTASAAVAAPQHNLDYSDASSPRATGFSIEPARKKRGRPRKYSPDGNIALGLSPTPVTPISSGVPPTDSGSGGGGDAEGPSSENPSKKARGRPPGSGKKQLDALGAAGVGFTPHVITVNVGEDIASKIMAFSQQGPRTVCILSANGAICNVTLRQPAMGSGTITYEGRYEIISLTGSFMQSENNGSSGPSGLSVSLAGADGRVMGGGVSGVLMAATPVQVIVGSFLAEGKKPKSKVPSSTPPSNMLNFGAPATGESPPSQGDASSDSSEENGDSPFQHESGPYGNAGQPMHGMSMYANMGWPKSL